MEKTCDLTNRKCKPCEGGMLPLTESEIQGFLPSVKDWTLSHDKTSITKMFKFKGFNKTMGFVNALAWIANQENHHPDLKVGYDYCEVTYTTHAITGLSENDFICAAKEDGLLD